MLAQELHGGELGVRGGRDVIEQADQADVADPSQSDDALAVLRRLLGIGRLQACGRAWAKSRNIS